MELANQLIDALRERGGSTFTKAFVFALLFFKQRVDLYHIFYQ